MRSQGCFICKGGWEIECHEWIKPIISHHLRTGTEMRFTYQRRLDAEAESPVRWPPVEKGRLTRKDPDAGED